MPELISKAAVLKIIFDSVGQPATAIYQKVRELPGAAIWHPGTEKPPVETVELDEKEGTRSRISVPVLAIVRDGSRQVVRWIDEEAAEPDGYEWHGWVDQSDGGTEDVRWWMELPKGPEPELPRGCFNCEYSRERAGALRCFGEKEAPEVKPGDCCESWVLAGSREGKSNG